MVDPRARLDRPVLGDTLPVPWVPVELFARLEVEERKDPVKPHREPVTFTQRETRKKGDPSPNAPKLIRLVRYPFALQTSAFKHDPAVSRKPEPREARPALPRMRELRREDDLAPRPRATERPQREPRPRPSSREWLSASTEELR